MPNKEWRMQHLSIIDEQALDPFLARAALDRLRSRSYEAAVGALAASVLGVLLLIFGNGSISLAAFAGSVAGAVVLFYARADRAALIARLVRQRSAYDIPEVATA